MGRDHLASATGTLVLNVLYGPRIAGDAVQFVDVRPPTTNWPVRDRLSQATRFPSIVHVDELYPQVVWLNCSTDSNPKATVTWYRVKSTGQPPQLHGHGERLAVNLYRDSMPPRLDRKWKPVQSDHRHPVLSTTSGVYPTPWPSGYPGPQIWSDWLLHQLINFTCVARVPGFPQQSAIRLIGQAGPPLVTGSSPVYAALGSSAVIDCDIRGLPKPNEENIRWRFQFISGQPHSEVVESQKQLQQIQESRRLGRSSGQNEPNQPRDQHPHWHVRKTDVPLGWISQLTIDSVEARHYGLYNCSATSPFGTGWQLFVLNQAPTEDPISGQITMEHLAQLLTILLLISIAAVLAYLIWFRQRVKFRHKCPPCCPQTGSKIRGSYLRSLFFELRQRSKSEVSQTGFHISPQSYHIVNRFDMEISSEEPYIITNPMLHKYNRNIPSKSVSDCAPLSLEHSAGTEKSMPAKRYHRPLQSRQSLISHLDQFQTELYAPSTMNQEHILVSSQNLSEMTELPVSARISRLHGLNQVSHSAERRMPALVHSPHCPRLSRITDCSAALVDINNSCELQRGENID
ncbi:hypothetical protein FGIG_06209 [Fasciola gigantica]|uniref:Ig-like domain-containing protein n=1 Tax=Fasciola gigantica TaxID=46835 RepID=A0A504YWW9_FASGI|nr:hypothetical protein FGIG_06209 [Fasciola gigantica]